MYEYINRAMLLKNSKVWWPQDTFDVECLTEPSMGSEEAGDQMVKRNQWEWQRENVEYSKMGKSNLTMSTWFTVILQKNIKIVINS